MEHWFANDKVQLEYLDTLGRYLTSNVNVDSAVLMEEAPYVLSIDHRYLKHFCQRCAKMMPDAAVYVCPGCDEVAYCSRGCRDDDAPRHDTPCVPCEKRRLSECDCSRR